MYIHIYQCKNCKAFGTENCTWKDTKENNVACVDFEPIISTTSATSTTPIYYYEITPTCTSSTNPIELTTKTE